MHSSSRRIEINHEELGEGHILIVKGDIDLRSSPRLRDTILEKDDDRTAGLLIDLSGVHYIDSSGLATLLEGKSRFDSRRAGYGLVGVQGHVLDVLIVAHLDGVFPIYESREDGAEALGLRSVD